MLFKETPLDFVVALLVERTNLDANRASMVLRKIRKAFTIIEYRHQPVFMHDRIFIESVRRAVAHTPAA
jgi:hypothetical protein